jgi:hypothetical protein
VTVVARPLNYLGSTPRSRADCRSPRAELEELPVLFANIVALVIDGGGRVWILANIAYEQRMPAVTAISDG